MPKTYAEGFSIRYVKSFLERRQPDESSRILTHSTIKALDDDVGIPFSVPLFHTSMWHFFGEELCQKLEIPKVSRYHRFVWHLFGHWFADCRRVDRWFPLAKRWKNYWFMKYLENVL